MSNLSNTYGYKSGYTNKTAPYPLPQNIQQARENLQFFRKEANQTQASMSKLLNLEQSTYSSWENDVDSKDRQRIMPPMYLKLLADVLKCNPDLINPACPNLYAGRYKNFPPVIIKKKLVFCVENPKTREDCGNNLTYFIAFSGYTGLQFTKALGYSSSSLTAMKKGIIASEKKAHEIAEFLNCPIGLIYMPQPLSDQKKLLAAKLSLIEVPNSIDDLKNNLTYFIKHSSLSLSEIAKRMNLEDQNNDSTHILARAMDPRKGTYLKTQQCLALANLLGFDARYILMSSIYSAFGEVGKVDEVINDFGHNKQLSTLLNIEDVNNLTFIEVTESAVKMPNSEDYLKAGNVVAIDTTIRDPKECRGSIVAIKLVDSSIILRRVAKLKGSWLALSDNSDCEPNKLNLKNKDVEIYGLVKFVITKQ